MIERPGTWGELEIGTMCEDKDGFCWYVLARERGWTQMRTKNGNKRAWRDPPPDTPIVIVEPSEEEALYAARTGLGAKILQNWRHEETIERQAKKWIVPALATRGRGAADRARSHISWYHGAYANGTSLETGGWKTIKQILAAHEEMHEAHFMDAPHTHKEA